MDIAQKKCILQHGREFTFNLRYLSAKHLLMMHSKVKASDISQQVNAMQQTFYH